MLKLRRLPSRLSEDRGSVVIMTVFNLLMFTVFGFVTIDVGLFMNERRDAQSDVDKIALAGALELTLNVDPAQQAVDEAAALAMSAMWAEANGVDPTDPLYSATVIYNCFSADDGFPTGVTVTVERTPLAFFTTLWGIVDWDVSASATACAGRPIDHAGFLPFALSQQSSCFVDNGADAEPRYTPRLGERCDIDIDTNSTGLAGELGIAPDAESCDDGNSSAAVLEENIVGGVQVTCSLGDTVIANAGHNVGKTISGIRARLAADPPATYPPDGSCEANLSSVLGAEANFIDGNAALNDVLAIPLASPSRNDGMDDFFETWAYAGPSAFHPAAELDPYDCSPEDGLQKGARNISLIVVEDFAVPDGDAGPKSYIVKDFARMYLEGCSKDGVFYKDCLYSGGGKFTIHARFVEEVTNSHGDLGVGATFGDIEIFLKR